MPVNADEQLWRWKWKGAGTSLNGNNCGENGRKPVDIDGQFWLERLRGAAQH